MDAGKQADGRTLQRRLHILNILPEDGGHGAPMKASEIASQCTEQGFRCTTRAVQRDMAAMHETDSVWHRVGVRLEYESGATIQEKKWRHASGSKLNFMNRLSPRHALTLALIERDLQPFLPQSAYQDIAPDLQNARRILENADSRYASYRDRVRVIPEGPPRGMPAPVAAVLPQISEALLKGEQADVRYASMSEDAGRIERDHRLHPVGLVQQGLFYWLLAVKDEHIFHPRLLEKVRTYRCDRISGVSARRSESVARGLPTLDEALAAGRLEFFAEEAPVTLTLRFASTEQGEALCTSFREAPLGSGQVIIPNGVGGHDLQTQVRHSLQLEWLLQRYADRIKVLAPAALAEHLGKFALAAAALQGEP